MKVEGLTNDEVKSHLQVHTAINLSEFFWGGIKLNIVN